tara:strand:- start:302 stop:1132 length:831 start_codon:yes stop_codon:yes gene_type:complete
MAGWNIQTWGLGTWGLLGDVNVPVTGQALTASLGNESVKTDVIPIPTGLPLTTATTTPTVIIAVEPPITGISMTANLGTADAGPDAMLTGNAMSMGLGTVDAFNTTGWGRLQWGINSWGRPGIDVPAPVTGIAMTAALGSPTEVSGDATIVANTLSVAQLTLGAVDPAPDAALTGNFMIGALGTLGMQGDVLPVPTGFSLSANLGTATVELNTPVDITGISLTAALGNETAFTDVTATFNGFGLTITLNSANALIWNEVNTGSAPIDPPGWREVVA